MPDDNNAELPNIKIIVPLKNLSTFISSLNFLMINTEIKLIFKWSQNCVLNEKVVREERALIPAGTINVPHSKIGFFQLIDLQV